MRWTSLHHHTTFSYGDGYGTPEQHVDRAAELGLGALALTEHGNVSSHVRLEKAATKAGVKPIFGCELYTGAVDENTKSKWKWHLTVLAENEVGYQNLLRLVSRGWAEGFYYEPTVSGEMLAEHSEGLLVLSGCSGSKLACDLLGGKGVEPHEADMRAALATARRFKALLGDRYYLEAQAFPELERSKQINKAQLEISSKLNIPIVATGDIHYPRPADNTMQIMLHAISRGGKTGSFEHQAQSWGYDVSLAPADHLSDKSIVDRMVATGMPRRAAIRTVQAAADIAERCNVVIPKMERLRFPSGEHSSVELIWQWLRDGWKYRCKLNPALRRRQREYVERLKYEMDLIVQKDFIDYFLMLSEAVRWAKDHGIPVGPARGSAAASLVCYLLRITEIDPVPYPVMLFERFIDINRMDLPDVDLDFDDERRHEVTEHMIEVWGADRVGVIGSFQRYRGKNSLDDTARVFGVPKYAVEGVKDLLIERSGGDARFDATIEDTLEMFETAQETFTKFPDLQNALRLEGNIKNMGMHAAGLVIANEPLTKSVAVYTRKDSKGRERQVVSVDKYDAEHLNVLKADFLGLTTMGIIRRALEMIGMPLEKLYAIPLDDPITLRGFKVNDVVGVFQFDGRSTKSVNREVKPDNFMEIADVNALSRPGPLHSGTAGDYIAVKAGMQQPVHFHPLVDDITGHTKGCIVYQEQILQLVRVVGGFPWTHASEIRRIISQKKGEAAFNKMEGMFIEGAAKLHNIDRETALAIWKRLVTAGTYAFNSAHSVSYGMLAFWTMWLKLHHTQAFFAAALTKADDVADVRTLLRDAVMPLDLELRQPLSISPPDVVRSGVNWLPDGERGLLAGFSQVPGIGEKLAERIVEAREENPKLLMVWEQLENVNGFGPAKMQMVREFSAKEDPFEIYKVQRKLDVVRAAIRNKQLPLPTPTHTSNDLPYGAAQQAVQVTWVGIPTQRNLRDLYEYHRSRTGEELDPNSVKDNHLTESMVIYAEDEFDFVNLTINRWKYPHFKAAVWGMKLGEDVLVVKGKKLASFGRTVHVESLWVLSS